MDTDSPDMATDTVTDMDMAILVTAEEAGRLVGVSARTVRRWIQRGILPAVATDDGQRVVPADLPPAKRAAGGHGHGRGHGHGHGHDAPVTDTVMATDTVMSTPATVSPAAVAQLEAIRDQWLRPLMERNEDLARENGRLAAERDAAARERDRAQQQLDADRSIADQLVDLLQAERDAALAEVARLSAIPPMPAPSVTVSGPAPVATPAPWWRFWERR